MTSMSSEKKRKRRIIESDDDEPVAEPKSSSKSDKSSSKKLKQSPKKLAEVDLMGMFGSEPVKRKERPKAEPKKVDTSVIELMDEDSIDLSTADLDVLEKSIKIPTPVKTERRQTRTSSDKKSEPTRSSSRTPDKKVKQEPKEIQASAEKPKPKLKIEPSSPPASPAPNNKSIKTSAKKSAKKPEKVKEFSVEDDEARHERKQASIALYHKMKSRPTVLNPGSKEIPEGKPDCLKGCQFVISGVLESMERDEAASLIKSCGGVVSTGLSKKVTHMLVGDDAGPSKLAKADEMNIKQVSEDELLDMIREKSGLKKTVKVEKKEDTKDSPGKENKLENDDKKSVKKSPVKSQSYDDEPSKVVTKTSSSSSSVSLSADPQSDDIVYSLVDKYKPTNVKQIVGQQGTSGNATKLMNWLAKWEKNNDGTKKHAKPNPWAKNDDGSAFKAALLSGELLEYFDLYRDANILLSHFRPSWSWQNNHSSSRRQRACVRYCRIQCI